MTESPTGSVELSADPEQISAARRFVRSRLGDVDERLADDALLVTSELVTNAIEHGAGDAVTVTVHLGDGDVVVSVDSHGPSPGVGPVEGWRLTDEDTIDGRGLGIVRAIAAHVDVSRSGDRLRISAQLAR